MTNLRYPIRRVMRLLLLPLMGLGLVAYGAVAVAQYSWQEPHVKILPNGDLQWAPQPYVFEAGDEVRYIDYENGDDANSGATKNDPWKHHPWDFYATGNAAAASGPITYVFKGGVIYRGQLEADESGEPGNPIRLTADPDWGEGRPWFFGSSKLPANWVRATEVDHPERLPEPGKVWALNLKEAGLAMTDKGLEFSRIEIHPAHKEPRTSTPNATNLALHLVRGPGQYEALHLARTPDWEPMGENFALDYWHTVDAPAERNGVKGFKDEIWAGKGLPEDYFDGGYVWMGWRGLMGTPTPSVIENPAKTRKAEAPYFEPEEGVLLTNRFYGHGKGGLPYMIENLPQFLDAPGEFYIDNASGYLFVRAPEDADPNQLHLELTDAIGAIKLLDKSHIEIAGLGFAFTHGETILAENEVKDFTIRHCEFRNLGETAVRMMQNRFAESLKVMDRVAVTDCNFEQIADQAIVISGTWQWNDPVHRGWLEEANVLRNRTFETGYRQRGQRFSNVAAISLDYPQRGEIAGNIVRRSFGSGIVVHGGKNGSTGGYDNKKMDAPMIRILVHHNKTEDTALGVNDYGGLALWQGGPTYAWSNNIGNSPGHIPAGFWGVTRPVNLSYPLYLDGAFKQYSFNNIIWGRTTDKNDPYANTTPAYWMVFGFLNQFTNNTVYRQASGMGGSSGNRNDIVGNLFSDITDAFIESNRIGDPSLVGGGDDSAASGLRGIPTLAFARNLFQGEAEAGYLIREKEQEAAGLAKRIEAAEIEELAQQMQEFPMRVATLGERVEVEPIIGAPPGPITELTEEVDFNLKPDSPAIDKGGIYFMPWSLHGTVGEWNFVENHADPTIVVDYHWWMSEAHYNRQMYEQVPTYDLILNSATLEDFRDGPSEDWARSALVFDGQRVGKVSDESMRKDLKINLGLLDAASRRDVPLPGDPWSVDKASGKNGKFGMEDFMTYPGDLRKTPVIRTENLLIEALFATENGHNNGMIVGKFDGEAGYGLGINPEGQAEFFVASGGQRAAIATEAKVNDGQWHHVIGEIDRETGRMTIYLDGKQSAQVETGISPEISIDTNADLLVGQASGGSAGFVGALDFLRICRGTLEDSHTDIAELYEWQTNGPFRKDFMGRDVAGERRDIGALEHL